MAKAPMPGGYVYAVGASRGVIFVQYQDKFTLPTILEYKSLAEFSIPLQRMFLAADWAPRDAVPPLELLAMADEETDSGQES